MSNGNPANTTHLALRYETDFVSHLEERFHVSRATARALLESWVQGLPGDAAVSDTQPRGELGSLQHRIQAWVEVGLERLAGREEELSLRDDARG